MAKTITIPKELAGRDDLVVIPRKEYEKLAQLNRKMQLVKTFKPSAALKKDVRVARKDYKRGEYITLEQLERELGITRKKAR